MHSVIETNAYLAAAKDAGMSADEQQAVVDLIAANPEAGDIMPGCGGARKLRVARPGSGKSGVSDHHLSRRGQRADVLADRVRQEREDHLTKGERNALAALTKILAESLGRQR